MQKSAKIICGLAARLELFAVYGVKAHPFMKDVMNC